MRKYLPKKIKAKLFGDREKFGERVIPDDPDWVEWLQTVQEFYETNQKSGIGKIVNDAGYKMLRSIDFSDKVVFEIGPGWMPHRRFWNGVPRKVYFTEVDDDMAARTIQVLEAEGIDYQRVPVGGRLAGLEGIEDETIDVIVSFYVLEHLTPLDSFIEEFTRVLKPGGEFAAGIPAEGGLAWGLGRMMTTRRWLKKNTSINPDKIICWEHPNFADNIISEVKSQFTDVKVSYWPFGIGGINPNLICRIRGKK